MPADNPPATDTSANDVVLSPGPCHGPGPNSVPAAGTDWSGIVRRDPATFERLHREFWPALLRRARRLLREPLDPENAAAETMYLALRSARTYQPGRHPYPWLARICLRVCLRERTLAHRALGALQGVLGAPWRLLAPSTPVELAEGRERSAGVAALHDLVRALRPKAREAVLLRFLFQVSTREIAELRGVEMEVIRQTILRGLRELASRRSARGRSSASGDAARRLGVHS